MSLTRLTLTRLTGTRLAFTGLAGLPATGIELILQVAERVIRQALLVAQSVRQALHRLLALAPLAAFALSDLHVLHQLAKLLEQFGGFGHPPLFHQLLQLIEHLLQLVLGNFGAVLVLRRIGPVGRL